MNPGDCCSQWVTCPPPAPYPNAGILQWPRIRFCSCGVSRPCRRSLPAGVRERRALCPQWEGGIPLLLLAQLLWGALWSEPLQGVLPEWGNVLQLPPGWGSPRPPPYLQAVSSGMADKEQGGVSGIAMLIQQGEPRPARLAITHLQNWHMII